ncbi:S-layer homology domain-containing protein [Paenibacillus eucommiae]|uniref:Helix-turn-helix protein n=1 Tax=Paenibacillus eucommiae TaxID=1355755 RepID=A0ABS4IQ23_9BACL|nr:S-layer homology domain-containing protein [Paenibacillus eucommiae]MBP1989230.1 helix-turn-helix protein [Paenibacillus eucommiae]
MKKMFIALLAASLLTACDSQKIAADSVQDITLKKTVSLTDVTGHWAANSIHTAIQKEYVDGYEDATFRPEKNVSRAEFIKMTVTAMKLPVAGEVTGSEWYEPYIVAATEKGILRTNDFRLEDINKPISRLEMARVSVRASDKTFQDRAVQIDDKSVMYNATKTGLIQGLSRGELAPEKPTTRAQSVTIIERILTTTEGGKLPVDKYALSNAELDLKNTNIFSMLPEIFGGEQFSDGQWNPGNLFVESKDGKYKATLDKLILIDLEDPNDPNLGLLGDISKLKWHNNVSNETSPYIKDFKKSYILYYKSHVDYNNDKSLYNDYSKYISLSLSGINSPDIQAFYYKNTLNTPTLVFKNQIGDTPAMIIPKKGYVLDSSVAINLDTPARSNYLSKMILRVLINKK